MAGLKNNYSSPLRVMYLLTTLDGGGAERSLLELIRRLDRTRFEPSVCALISGGGLRHSFSTLGVPVAELGVTPGLAEVRGARLFAMLLRGRPAIVHSRLILSNLWARLGVLVGAKVICEERGLADERPGFVSFVNRTTLRLCSMNVANSTAVASRMRLRDRIRPSHLRVIYGGVDCDRFSPNSAKEARAFDIVTTTRLEEYKGGLDLIEAMRLVQQRRPRTRLSIVGDGVQRPALERRIDQYGLGGNITLWGQQSDVPTRLREARMFVLSSYEEGLPNAVLEAMASGLPVVATRVGGTPELVADGSTGRLVPPHDPSALAEAILHYLETPGLIESHGAGGRIRAQTFFDIRATVSAYEQLYIELTR